VESTLNLKLTDYAGDVGDYLGWGRGADNGDTAWDARKTGKVASLLKSGYRQFLYPPPVEGSAVMYSWSFLQPVVTLPLALTGEGTTVVLPPDFAGMIGDVYLSREGQNGLYPLKEVPVGFILERQSVGPTTSGRPLYFCVEALKQTGAASSPRKQFRLWPVSDGEYSVQFQYYLVPNAIDIVYPYAYGGAPHAETVRAACLMAAEQDMDDERGIWKAQFQERLVASIGVDMRDKPRWIGYNADRSDGRRAALGPTYSRHLLGFPAVTVNGVQY